MADNSASKDSDAPPAAQSGSKIARFFGGSGSKKGAMAASGGSAKKIAAVSGDGKSTLKSKSFLRSGNSAKTLSRNGSTRNPRDASSGLFSGGSKPGNKYKPFRINHVTKTDDEWKEELPDYVHQVLRGRFMEAPYKKKYPKSITTPERYVLYACVGCHTALYDHDDRAFTLNGYATFNHALVAKTGEKTTELVDGADPTTKKPRVEVQCMGCNGFVGVVVTNPEGEEVHQVNQAALNRCEVDDLIGFYTQ